MAVRRKTFAFGGAAFASLSPDRPVGRPKVQNIKLGLEDMLLLREALTAAIQEANALDRRGAGALYNMSVKYDTQRIDVVRDTTRAPRKKKG